MSFHDFSITDWAYPIQPEIMLDIEAHMTGYNCNSIEKCTKRLLAHDIDVEEDGEIDLNVYQFWDEFKNFQKGKFMDCSLLLCLFTLLIIFHRTGCFKINWYNLIDSAAGNSVKWHSKYFRHYTEVFGYLAYHTTLKDTGIGAAES